MAIEIDLPPRDEFAGPDGSEVSEGSGGSIPPYTHRGLKVPEGVQNGSQLLDEVRSWLARHIVTTQPGDLDVLTVWAAHTHLTRELYSTPRLQIDSAIPGSGKTTVLEHLERLCYKPVVASSISSPALLARLVGTDPRTVLLDEVDRTLNPKKEGVGELIALINSGYKAGGSRPTLMPVKGGGWEPKELSTFAPVAMAGNQPSLPDDTKTRIIRVLLLPDVTGRAEESDWELKDLQAAQLGARLAAWARQALDLIKDRPTMPEGVTGRYREKWQPLARVAQAAGGDWLERILQLAADDVDDGRRDKEEGLAVTKPHILALQHIVKVWPADADFVSSGTLVDLLIDEHPETWGAESTYGKDLTQQRLGRLLVPAFNIRTITADRADKNAPRGYRRTQFDAAIRALSGGSSEPAPHRPIEPSERSEGPEPSGRSTTCRRCREPLDDIDGTGTHPGCTATGGGRK